MKHIYDMIIVGGGPAGYTAALYASRAGLDVLTVERMAPGGQMALTDTIDNYPGFEDGIDGFTLGMKMQQGAKKFGAKTEYAEVKSVDFSDKVKKLKTSNDELLTKTVVIATGANPKELGLKEEWELMGKGVHYCAHCDGRFYKGKTVIVVGGGNSAAEDALYLSRIAKKVYLVHRGDTLKATKIYQEPLFNAENIEILWNSEVKNILSDEKVIGAKVKNNKTNEDRTVDCEGVFISIGRKPATEFLKNELTLDNYGYIIADESTKTNVDGVYAVGDVRTKPLRQVVTAVSDGAVAVNFAEEYLAMTKFE
ncbi:MAG: thioredoxin-disulfide reductase [Clostridia bacterium]|nr:thioredoxin-disulfide reductase [Clostridia bacterium]MBO5299551.1 thioredoxin-disulfide reductase [Clostridia bacterium]